eukprot:TRINITY_DN1661_c0_g1_i1.p1 TRINITY_DN1661_c0_g1~~TRINITY_DN1661_c0_g1_i1.p1  ORF type:complete len:1063 (+),score=285.42 TRINITY_DN1661_c0_g1_i1:36-3191(+)
MNPEEFAPIFIEACQNLQDTSNDNKKESEEVLKHLRQVSSPYNYISTILESTDENYVILQAIVALRECLDRDFFNFSKEERDNVYEFLSYQCFANSNIGDAYIHEITRSLAIFLYNACSVGFNGIENELITSNIKIDMDVRKSLTNYFAENPNELMNDMLETIVGILTNCSEHSIELLQNVLIFLSELLQIFNKYSKSQSVHMKFLCTYYFQQVFLEKITKTVFEFLKTIPLDDDNFFDLHYVLIALVENIFKWNFANTLQNTYNFMILPVYEKSPLFTPPISLLKVLADTEVIKILGQMSVSSNFPKLNFRTRTLLEAIADMVWYFPPKYQANTEIYNKLIAMRINFIETIIDTLMGLLDNEENELDVLGKMDVTDALCRIVKRHHLSKIKLCANFTSFFEFIVDLTEEFFEMVYGNNGVSLALEADLVVNILGIWADFCENSSEEEKQEIIPGVKKTLCKYCEIVLQSSLNGMSEDSDGDFGMDEIERGSAEELQAFGLIARHCLTYSIEMLRKYLVDATQGFIEDPENFALQDVLGCLLEMIRHTLVGDPSIPSRTGVDLDSDELKENYSLIIKQFTKIVEYLTELDFDNANTYFINEITMFCYVVFPSFDDEMTEGNEQCMMEICNSLVPILIQLTIFGDMKKAGKNIAEFFYHMINNGVIVLEDLNNVQSLIEQCTTTMQTNSQFFRIFAIFYLEFGNQTDAMITSFEKVIENLETGEFEMYLSHLLIHLRGVFLAKAISKPDYELEAANTGILALKQIVAHLTHLNIGNNFTELLSALALMIDVYNKDENFAENLPLDELIELFVNVMILIDDCFDYTKETCSASNEEFQEDDIEEMFQKLFRMLRSLLNQTGFKKIFTMGYQIIDKYFTVEYRRIPTLNDSFVAITCELFKKFEEDYEIILEILKNSPKIFEFLIEATSPISKSREFANRALQSLFKLNLADEVEEIKNIVQLYCSVNLEILLLKNVNLFYSSNTLETLTILCLTDGVPIQMLREAIEENEIDSPVIDKMFDVLQTTDDESNYQKFLEKLVFTVKGFLSKKSII